MGLFDGFMWLSKDERERRRKDFHNRVVPLGVDAQKKKLEETLTELYHNNDIMNQMFAFYDAKDAWTKKETDEEGRIAALYRLDRLNWLNDRDKEIMLRFIELEKDITSLDDFPSAADILAGLPNES